MHYVTPDLCDAYPELVQVVEPMFSNFGGRDSFGGEIVTIKCFEDNSLVKGAGRQGTARARSWSSMAVVRCAAPCWATCWPRKRRRTAGKGSSYGCIRDVDVIAQTDLGVQALASHPLKTDKRGIGDLNVAVTFGGVTFRPGEFVYADNNGIIVSPQALKMPE